MRRHMLAMAVACALALIGSAAWAEEMPIVTDEPLTGEEIPAAEAERVRQVQQMLIDLGLLNGAADGQFGPKTAEALRLFQSKNGLVASGEMNEVTLAALREKSAVAVDAKGVQQRLIDLGYLRGLADGIFGERSVAALKLFQAMAGLEATGSADDATREALFSDDARALPARLTGGDKGDAVTALQERLRQLGFLDGKADGSYGRATASAVRRFQRHLIEQGVDEALGITASGEATPATQALLFDEGYSTYIRDIASGDEGDEVLRLERRLADLGYMDAEPDEAFDDYAASAAAAFREACGLDAGETVDRATVDALFAADAPTATAFVPHAISKGDRGLAVRAVEAALVCGGMQILPPAERYNDALVGALKKLHDYLAERGDANAALFEDPEALSVEAQAFLTDTWLSTTQTGDDPATFERIQRRLNTLLYLSRAHIGVKAPEEGEAVEPDEVTVEAIREFQRVNRLPVTGVADIATRNVLFSDAALTKPVPYRIDVSIADQRVYVYERTEAGEYELVQTFICSTGMGNSTPRGYFLDGFPVNVWHHFEKFDCWAKYSYVIEGDIMFHSVLFDKDDTETLRENSLYALGQKASHGCIRLKVKDARWIFQNCKRGTAAIVID